MKKQLLVVAAAVAFSGFACAQTPTAPANSAEKTPVVAPPAQAEKGAQLAFENLMSAIEDDDYPAFVLAVDDNTKAAVSKPLFEKVVAQIAPRQQKGYASTYLGELKKNGFRVHLWKLTFDDKGDDMLAQLSLKDGKIGGFFLR